MKRWLVFNVGCIECRVSSNIVGTYDSQDEAQSVAEVCQQTLAWRQGGQNEFEVFDLSQPTAEEYLEALNSTPPPA